MAASHVGRVGSLLHRIVIQVCGRYAQLCKAHSGKIGPSRFRQAGEREKDGRRSKTAIVNASLLYSLSRTWLKSSLSERRHIISYHNAWDSSNIVIIQKNASCIVSIFTSYFHLLLTIMSFFEYNLILNIKLYCVIDFEYFDKW